MASAHDVTALLGEWSRGNRDALNALLPRVYGGAPSRLAQS